MFATPAFATLMAVVSGQTAQPDPIFSHQFESGVVALRPNLSEVPVGAANSVTYPYPLVVRLDSAVASDTFVPLISSDPARLQIAGGGATVLAGQSQATVRVDALAAGAPVIVRANLGNAVAAGVRVEAAANETDASAEADFCNIQFPLAATANVGDRIQTIFGQLFEAGVTAAAGAPPGWIAQAGWGPQLGDPRAQTGWVFGDATYNVQVGNNDEFRADLLAPPVAGPYSYAYRFSPDGGATWTYCDSDGAGSNMGLAFSTGNLGVLTVTPLVAHLVINEVDYDQFGTDTAEFVEIFNGTSVDQSLANLAVVLVNGNDSQEYARIDLAAAGVLAAGQFLVIASPGVFVPDGAIRIEAPVASGFVQNGSPDGIALVNVSTQTVIDALSYEGSITAAQISGFPFVVSLVEGTATTVTDGETPVGSLARFPNGTDTDNASGDWHFAGAVSPGAPNY
jgi:hypothetical protein